MAERHRAGQDHLRAAAVVAPWRRRNRCTDRLARDRDRHPLLRSQPCRDDRMLLRGAGIRLRRLWRARTGFIFSVYRNHAGLVRVAQYQPGGRRLHLLRSHGGDPPYAACRLHAGDVDRPVPDGVPCDREPDLDRPVRGHDRAPVAQGRIADDGRWLSRAPALVLPRQQEGSGVRRHVCGERVLSLQLRLCAGSAGLWPWRANHHPRHPVQGDPRRDRALFRGLRRNAAAADPGP